MLTLLKKYIHITFVVVAVIIFALLITVDIIQMQKNSKYHYKSEMMQDDAQIQDVYAKLLEKANEESTTTKKTKETTKLGDIDTYATNKWRIKIPKLRIDAPISEGTNQEALRRTVGHFEQTDKWTGNVALAAHNRGYKCNFFQDIKNLEIGDIIIYSTEKGERKYQVTINKIIKETNWKYIRDTDDNRLTLITCETNKREYRRCIQAIEMK